jgi:hypothetical protein
LGIALPQPSSTTNLPENFPQIPEEEAPSSVLISSAEREVYIETNLKKSQERINRAFAKFLHAKSTE